MTDEIRVAAEKKAQDGNTKLLNAMQRFEHAWKPEYVAPIVAWLCTDEAAHVNGRTFLVAGPVVSLFSEPEPVRQLFSPNGYWTLDELVAAMPGITADLRNPAQAQ